MPPFIYIVVYIAPESKDVRELTMTVTDIAMIRFRRMAEFLQKDHWVIRNMPIVTERTYMKIRLRIISAIGVITIIIGGLTPAASATTTTTGTGAEPCTYKDPIASGLWTGFSLATGMPPSCKSSTTDRYKGFGYNPNGGNANTTTNGCVRNGSSGYSGIGYDSSRNGGNGCTGTNVNDGYVEYDQNGYPKELPRTAATTNQAGGYVALGDSVAAGLGAGPTQSGTTDPACRVSTQAYPTVVASALGRQYRNVACSGATVGDLVTEQHLSGTTRDIEPQLDQAFAGGVPSLMTLTAGANDVRTQYFVRKCTTGTCGTGTDQVLARQLVTAMQLKLNYALRDIARRSGGSPPRVVITGYYYPLSLACTQQQSAITPSEVQWVNSQTDALNQALANTANNFSFVRYVPVDFRGHELCTTDPWVQGLQDPAPVHPTAQGQRAIARSVLGAMR